MCRILSSNFIHIFNPRFYSFLLLITTKIVQLHICRIRVHTYAYNISRHVYNPMYLICIWKGNETTTRYFADVDSPRFSFILYTFPPILSIETSPCDSFFFFFIVRVRFFRLYKCINSVAAISPVYSRVRSPFSIIKDIHECPQIKRRAAIEKNFHTRLGYVIRAPLLSPPSFPTSMTIHCST